MASLADAGIVTIGVTDLAVAGAAPLADAGMVFPADPAGMVSVGVTNLTDVTPVNVIGVPECGSAVSWDDRLSPGVWCREKTLIRKNSDVQFDNSIRCDPADTNCTVPADGSAGSLETLLFDPR